eukprot:CFRG7154T1
MTGSPLNQPLVLPCGAVLKNRIAKGAMTEGMATAEGRPTEDLNKLYKTWAEGGAGLLITGNVQIDNDHLERLGNVIIEKKPDEDMHERLSSWAKATTINETHLWAQISHGGRQTNPLVNSSPKAPSAVKVKIPGFGQPVAMTVADIKQVVQRFGIAAKALKDAGFSGVQLHAAHGYLLSSFLSNNTNQRTDQYGGSLENRARLLLESVAECRAAVGPSFPIAVKLNSADFQRGGFSEDDSVQVVEWLEKGHIDLVEVSGGNYESPEMFNGTNGKNTDEFKQQSTIEREAYFLTFAKKMKEKITVPLMVTGGFRTREVMEYAIVAGGTDLVGLARPMCVLTDCPNKLIDGTIDVLPNYENECGVPKWAGFVMSKVAIVRKLDLVATVSWFYSQLYSVGRSGEPAPSMTTVRALYEAYTHDSTLAKDRKEWKAKTIAENN